VDDAGRGRQPKLKTTREAGHIKKWLEGIDQEIGPCVKALGVGKLSSERLGAEIGVIEAGALQIQFDDVQRKINEFFIRAILTLCRHSPQLILRLYYVSSRPSAVEDTVHRPGRLGERLTIFPDRRRLSRSSIGRRNTNGSGEVVRERQAGSGSVQMASLETKPKELPQDFEIFVQAEFLVASDHRDLFAHSLGNDLAVERVRVVWREIEKIERMTRRIGQYAKVQILKRAVRVCGGKP
jgi:hypothetical protein